MFASGPLLLGGGLGRYITSDCLVGRRNTVLLFPSTSTQAHDVLRAPLVVHSNAALLPDGNRRTTVYRRLGSVLSAVERATSECHDSAPALALDQLMTGPINAFYTASRGPLRIPGGRTVVVLDGWSLGPSYCAASTHSSSQKRSEDDMMALMCASAHNSASVRLYTARPVCMVDVSVTTPDVQGHDLKRLYTAIHRDTPSRWGCMANQRLAEDLVTWGYINTHILCNSRLTGAGIFPGTHGVSCAAEAAAGQADEGEEVAEHKAVQLRYPTEDEPLVGGGTSTRGSVLDRRPYREAKYFEVTQFRGVEVHRMPTGMDSDPGGMQIHALRITANTEQPEM
jgi:hypothetical protein